MSEDLQPGGGNEPGRPNEALTPDDISTNKLFISYIPGQGGDIIRGRFAGPPYWTGDESALVVDVIKDGDEKSAPIELCALGIGTNRRGETPSRVCIEETL